MANAGVTLSWGVLPGLSMQEPLSHGEPAE